MKDSIFPINWYLIDNSNETTITAITMVTITLMIIHGLFAAVYSVTYCNPVPIANDDR